MEILAKALGRFISRDVIYICAGLMVIISVGVTFPSLRLWKVLTDTIENEPIRYAAILGISYFISYVIFELASIFWITVNHEWWFPSENPVGRLVSWIHYRTHGLGLLNSKNVNLGCDKDAPLSWELAGPSTRAHDIVSFLNNLSTQSNGLGLVLYPHFIEHFDDETEETYWIARLRWLRFFAAIGGSCVLASSAIVLIGAIVDCAPPRFAIGILILLVGGFLAVHARYRLAQLTLIRLMLRLR